MADGTLSSNTTTAWVALPEGEALICLTGTFGSGTVVLQMQLADGVTAQNLASMSWTSAIATAVNLGGGTYVRYSLSGATNPSVKWEIHPKRVRVNGQLSPRY